MRARRLSWAALAVGVVVMLTYGSLAAGGDRSDSQRAAHIARSLRCPQCAGESVADSNVTVAVEMRADIARRVDDGESDEEILAFFAARYGEAVLLTPPGRGFAALVWIIPVIVGVTAAAALGLAFWRWRAPPEAAQPATMREDQTPREEEALDA